MLRLLLFFCILLFLYSSVEGQVSKTIRYFRHLEVKDGLPQNDIKEFLADDQNGYWFRTETSIIYYTGHEFITYEKGNNVFTISTDKIQSFNISKNKIYVFGDAGLDEIDCHSKRSRTVFKDSTGIIIRNGYVTKSGNIIVVSKNGSIYALVEGKLKQLGNIEYVAFFTIQETEDGNILISNNRRQLVVLSKQLNVVKTINLPNDKVLGGGIYTTKEYGTIAIISGNAYRFNTTSQSFDTTDLPYVFKRLFLMTKRYSYVVSQYNTIIQYDRHTGQSTLLNVSLSNNFYINRIGIDKYGTIVLSTNQGIILYQEPQAGFMQLPKVSNDVLTLNTARRSLIETPDHQILQIHYQGIDSFDPLTGINKELAKLNFFGYAGTYMDDKIWIGTDGVGLFRYDLKTRNLGHTSFNAELFKGKALHITAVSKINNRMLLLGTTISPVTLKTYDIKKDEYSDVLLKGWQKPTLGDKVTAIVDDSIGGKWVCTINGLLYISDSFVVRRYLGSDQLGTKEANHIYFDNKRELWIATDNGVLKYDLKADRILARYTVDDGLAGNRCIAVIPDAYGTLWIPTYSGLSRLDMRSGKIRNYYVKDGLADDEYNYSAFLKTSGGDIYLGGLNGYVRITPFPVDTTAQDFSSISTDYVLLRRKQGDSLLNLSAIPSFRLHRSDERISLSFSMKNFQSSEYLRYQYRIEGLHKDWVMLGRQNTIELAFLPPGTYTLNIRAKGVDDKYISKDLQIPFKVYSYWYESKLFYAVMMAFVIFSIVGIFYTRHNTAKSIGKMRTDLANDIHDEIGTMLTKATMRLEILRKKGHIDESLILPIENHLRDTVSSFRNVLWTLNTDNNKTEDFVGRLNLMLQEIFGDTNFEFIISNLSPNIYFKKSISVKRNLLLIIKELANNALKYSKGNLFEVVITSDGKRWKILVADNGENSDEHLEDKGLGLLSIRKRVEAINGEITIQKKSKGFFVTVYL